MLISLTTSPIPLSRTHSSLYAPQRRGNGARGGRQLKCVYSSADATRAVCVMCGRSRRITARAAGSEVLRAAARRSAGAIHKESMHS